MRILTEQERVIDGHEWEKLKHNLRLVRHYPEEVICEPFFRVVSLGVEET